MNKHFYFLVVLVAIVAAFQPSVVACVQEKNEALDEATIQDPVSIQANGILEARDPLQVVNKTGAEVAILWMAPDRSTVKKGELIFELDDSILQNQFNELSVELSNAQTISSNAESAMANLKVKFETAIANANREIQVAELNRRRQLGENGQLKVKLNNKKARLAFEKRKLEYFNNKLKALQSEDGNRDELHEIQFKLNEAQLNANELKSQIEFLDGPEREYLMARNQLEIKTTKSQIVQLQSEFKTELSNAEFESRRAKDDLDFCLENRKDLEHRIADCKIHAPQDGLLVHQNLFDAQTGYEFVVEEGALVRDRQRIAIMPDLDRLQIKVLISEEIIDRIEYGQSASIEFESTNSIMCQGKVFRVGVYPETVGWRNNGAKVYPVYIALDNCPKAVELGATADVTFDMRSKK